MASSWICSVISKLNSSLIYYSENICEMLIAMVLPFKNQNENLECGHSKKRLLYYKKFLAIIISNKQKSV